MSDYRIEIKVKNNNLLRKIEECGYSSVGEFCRRNGKMSWASTIGELVNLKKSPLSASGQFLPIVNRICDILLCAPEDLFSEVQLTTAIESNRRTIKVNEAEMQFMLETTADTPLLENQVDQDRLPGKVAELLETLTPREAKVIAMRFGIGNDGQAHTLEEVGKVFDVTRTRIRDIEARALSKLRHPSRSDFIREYLD